MKAFRQGLEAPEREILPSRAAQAGRRAPAAARIGAVGAVRGGISHHLR